MGWGMAGPPLRADPCVVRGLTRLAKTNPDEFDRASCLSGRGTKCRLVHVGR